MHACIHKTSRFIGGKGPRSIKIKRKGEVSIWTLTIIILSEARCSPQRFTLESTKVHNTQHM